MTAFLLIAQFVFHELNYDKFWNGFANRITMVWWIFALSCLMVIMIALLNVSIHTLKAAATNPVDSLRYE